MDHYGDEMQQRIDAYQELVDETDTIHQPLPDLYKGVFFSLSFTRFAGISDESGDFLCRRAKSNIILCIPTHAIASENGLRYAVAFGDKTPQIIGYDTAEWCSQWSVNILQGAAISESIHTVSDPGEHTLKIWMLDPGIVINKVVTANVPESHLGLPETVIR